MKIFLIRHGKSDKSLQDVLPHNEFELKRALVEGEEEKANQLGKVLKQHAGFNPQYDLVWSGKNRSRQTVLAIARGLGLSDEKANQQLREDFGLTYLATQEYWHACEQAVKEGTIASHAEYFLATPSQDPLTFSAAYMRANIRLVLRRAIERNTFLGNEVSIMVSHEPVISLCMSDLSEKTVTELGGSCAELEYASFEVLHEEKLKNIKVTLTYRNNSYDISSKIFDL